MADIGFIPAEGVKIDKQELHLARKFTLFLIVHYLNHHFLLKFKGDVLEIGAQLAIATNNITAFERYMTQLKSFYYDFK